VILVWRHENTTSINILTGSFMATDLYVANIRNSGPN
jgi:hypothetical protein